MTISEGPITTSSTGFNMLGQEVVITTDITGMTAGNPLVLVFVLDASLIPPGANENTIAIFRNGAPLPNCNVFPGSTTADPEPSCVSNRVLLTGADIQITVLTVTASHWTVGVPTARVTVNKTYSDSNTTPVTVTLTCTSGLVSPGSGVSGSASASPGSPAVFTVTGFGPTATCFATEGIAPPGYSKNEAACAVVFLSAGGTPSCTIINTAQATPTPTATGTPTGTPAPTATATPTPTGAPTPTPTATATPAPTATATPTATPALTCQGKAATRVGTPGNDLIFGTDGNDVIVALGGDDVVFGRGGNDTICLGDGRDIAFGGDGNDVILGEEGKDIIFGGTGNDSLDGGSGNRDFCHGGLGIDTATNCELSVLVP